MAENQPIAASESVEVSAVTETKETKADEGDRRKPLAVPHSRDTSIATAIVTGKRQLTLFEMAGEKAKARQPAAKKQKLADPESSTTVSEKAPVAAAATVPTSSLKPLNAIPFSLQGFKDALSEEERNLLALECETMGKSWWALDRKRKNPPSHSRQAQGVG